MNERKPIVVRIVVIALALFIGLGICFANPLDPAGLEDMPVTVELDNVTPTEPVEEEVAPAPSTPPETELLTEPETAPVETESASTTTPSAPQYTAPEPTAPANPAVEEEEVIIASAAAREALADPTFLAKLLYCEAGSMGWQGQVYVCSAILNLCDYSGKTIWSAGHNANMFAVAPIVDSAHPTQTQYDVIDYVINQGGRVSEIKYFRTDYYHDFGTPVCRIENVYFSK